MIRAGLVLAAVVLLLLLIVSFNINEKRHEQYLCRCGPRSALK